MQNIGIQTAFASSFLALFLALSFQTLPIEKYQLTATTGDICISQIDPNEVCECDDMLCMYGDDGTQTSSDECFNEFTDKPCVCGSIECDIDPDVTHNPPPEEECFNQYTQRECDCNDEQCLNEQPPEETDTQDSESDFDRTVECPFSQQTNREIIDFTNGGTLPARYLTIQANMGIEESTNARNVEISPGIYKVHLASYHQPKSTIHTGVNEERWHVAIYDSTKQLLLRTEPTHYVGHDEVLVKETVESGIEIDASTYKLVAKHEAYRSDEPYKFAPLCVVFDLVEKISVDEEEEAEAEAEDTTVADEVQETQTEEEVEEEAFVTTNPYLSTILRCPLERRENRIIIDFTKRGTVPLSDLRIASNGTLPYSKGPVSTTLPIGEYTVRFSSYGHKLNETDQQHQEWKLKLLDSKNAVVTETPPNRDIPSYITTDFTQKISDDFIVKEPVQNVVAIHERYKEDDPNAVAVICAAFDYHGEMPNEKPTDVETSEAESEYEPRDVFVPYDEQQSGVVDTATSVYMSPSEESLIESKPEDIGILSKEDVVKVEENVIRVRTDFMSQHEDTPFNTLLTSGREEREMIATRLLTRTSEEEEANDTEARITLTRFVTEEIDEVTQKEINEDEDLAFESFRIKKRTELASNEDSDGDGVTDYDELHIYKTNPVNPFTSGSTLTDGERILLGLNPLDRSTSPHPVLSPKATGEVVRGLYRVENIELLSQEESEKVRIHGQAESYAFVTLFVYSTPIVVTVRADSEGKFEYTFDETLEDGTHEVYVTSVNNTGKILAKSEPIPFVKTAQAIEYVPIAAVHEADPVNSSLKTAITLLFILVLLLTVSVVVWLGYLKSRQNEIAPQEVLESTENEEA